MSKISFQRRFCHPGSPSTMFMSCVVFRLQYELSKIKETHLIRRIGLLVGNHAGKY